LQELHWELKYFGKNATALDLKKIEIELFYKKNPKQTLLDVV